MRISTVALSTQAGIMRPDLRLKRVHYDWLEAGEHAQRTVAQLSQQLRRFLDDQAWLENRRIMDILHGIEAKALAVRQAPPAGEFMGVDDLTPTLELPLERPLYRAPIKAVIANVLLEAGRIGADEVDASSLFSQVRIDKAALASHVRQSLQTRTQISLAELLQARPLQQGLGELVAYLQMASESPHSVVDESALESVEWLAQDGEGGPVTRRAKLPRVIFVRR